MHHMKVVHRQRCCLRFKLSKCSQLPSRLILVSFVVQQSGGLHNDMAVHDFDMARFLVGSEVAEVYCKGSCKVLSNHGNMQYRKKQVPVGKEGCYSRLSREQYVRVCVKR